MSKTSDLIEVLKAQSKRSSEQIMAILEHVEAMEQKADIVYDGIVSNYSVDPGYKDKMSELGREPERIREIIVEHFTLQVEIAALCMHVGCEMESNQEIDVEALGLYSILDIYT